MYVDSRARPDEAVHHKIAGQFSRLRADSRDVDLRDCRALGLAARQLIDGDASTIYVDLGRVTFMSSILGGFLVQVGNAED